MRKVLKAEVAGQAVDQEYRVTVAVANTLEQQCLDKIELLMKPGSLLACLPSSGQTGGAHCLVFRMLSRLACGVHQLLVAPHLRFPIQLFRLLHGDGREAFADELRSTPNCLLGAFSADFLNRHRESLTGDEALASLAFVARNLKMEIVQIEAKRASIRRWLMGRSLQTHTVSFKNLGVAWILQRVRRARAVWPLKRSPQTNDAKEVAKAHPEG